jgi:hypothetical protein
MLSPEHSLGKGLQFKGIIHLHQHQVVTAPGRNYASHPSNPWTGLISAKRIALAKIAQRAKKVKVHFKPLLREAFSN